MSQQGSGEKTEKASKKKKEDARKRGEVHQSHDLVSAVSLTVIFALVEAGYAPFAEKMQEFLSHHLADGYVLAQADNLTPAMLQSIYRSTLLEILPIVLPLMLIVMVVDTALHVAQVGPLLTTERIKPNFSKISPIQGFKRLFSSVTIMELFKSLIKTAIMGVLIYRAITGDVSRFLEMMYLQPDRAFSSLIRLCAGLGIQIGAALIGFAAVDIFYQWWKYEKDLRMTKQEVKDENKQLEGDPQIKGKIRQLQRRMSTQRMMRNVPDADVVVTNPTHFAVALRYREGKDPAPVVVAKGQDLVAQQIKKIARENSVTIVENKPVARALYAACELGQAIPAELYQAIADILIYVYKVTNRMPTAK